MNRTEWMTASYAAVEAVPPNTKVDEHHTDQPALIVEADSIVVIEGDLSELRGFVSRLSAELDQLEQVTVSGYDVPLSGIDWLDGRLDAAADPERAARARRLQDRVRARSGIEQQYADAAQAKYGVRPV